MEERKITDDFFNNFYSKYLYGQESYCMHNDTELVKMIKKRLLKGDREKIIRELYYFDYPDIVKPLYAVIDKNKFVGYGMEYLKGYNELANYLNKEKPAFIERKDLVIKLSKIFDYFDTMKFAYHDLTYQNVMYKDNDIKLIDLDGGVLNGYTNYGLDYNAAVRVAKKSLAKMALYVINNTNGLEFDGLRANKKKKYVISFLDSLPENVKNLYMYALNNDFRYYTGITETLENITENISDDTQAVLKIRPRLF